MRKASAVPLAVKRARSDVPQLEVTALRTLSVAARRRCDMSRKTVAGAESAVVRARRVDGEPWMVALTTVC